MPLSAKKQRFVDNYLLDLNGAAAAIRAGYSPRGAAQAAHRLLQEPGISDAIAVAQAARSRRTGVSADRVVRELARVAFADIRDTVTWGDGGIRLRSSDDLDDDTAAAVSEVSESTQGQQRTLKVKLVDKLAALRLLAAHVGVGAAPAEGEDEDVEKTISDDPDPPRDDRGGT